jgi:ATPase family associated with various cellular activities (AAA)
VTPSQARELANRDAVVAELGVLRAVLRAGPAAELATAQARTAAARAALNSPSTLDEIATGFGLTAFERAVLLLAAGPELVAEVGDELTAVSGGSRLSFGTALALLPGAHWSAITPPAPLRRWGLVRLVDPQSPGHSPLVVDERVLHHIAGAGHLDAGLAAVTYPLDPPDWLPPALEVSAAQVLRAWRASRVALLHGPQPGNVRAVAASAAEAASLVALGLAAADVPPDAIAREQMLRRMERETVLSGCAWIVDVEGIPPQDVSALAAALARIDAPVALISRSPDTVPHEAVADVPVQRLPMRERREAMARALRAVPGVVPGEDDEAAGFFDVPVGDLPGIAREVAAGTRLWDACRGRARAGVGALATVLTPVAGWDDLVLPPLQLDQLRALVASVRHRTRVLDDWGFAARGPRGLGSTALFAGPSGTGKTLAAEVIARDLDLDLVRVDLSQVVSKWIGETEKHLARVFDAAEDGGCVLLFDEADTLFGKRSEVRDSHDRYANLEVGYLLQRMEAFTGLAVLTTNAPGALDPAFTRRLRTIVSFPYPDPALREALWRRAFPDAVPTGGLDPRQLAAIDVPGGGIAAVALTAAYLAADADGVVDSDRLRLAARWELAKSGRSLGGRRP